MDKESKEWQEMNDKGLELAVLEQVIRQAKVDAIKAKYSGKSLDVLQQIFDEKDAKHKIEYAAFLSEGKGIRGVINPAAAQQESSGIPVAPQDKPIVKRGRKPSKLA